jgi:hypothetical protein
MAATALKIFQIALFALFLAAPMAWLVIVGPAAPYEQRKQTDMPRLSTILVPEGEGRDQLADAIFERSYLRRTAIASKNHFMFEALGFADTDSVVSGERGWLFYKPELAAWNCEQLANALASLESVVMLGEIASAANAPFVLAIAPNKASIERNRLSGRAAGRASNCYDSIAKQLEERLAQGDLPAILHHTPLVNKRDVSTDRFFRTDTHWLPVTGFLAAGDLMQALGQPGFPEGFRPDTRLGDRATDLRRMLLLGPETGVAQIDFDAAKTREVIAANRLDSVRTLMVHDSFYAEIRDELQLLLPGVTMLHIEDDLAKVPDQLSKSNRLVVSTVERFLFSRISQEAYLGWLGPIGSWVLDYATGAADQCSWDKAVSLLSVASPEHLSISDGGYAFALTPDPQIIVTAPQFPGASTCLRLDVELSKPDIAQIFFATTDGRIVEGRSVKRRMGAGEARVQLILPSSAAGKDMRIDPVQSEGSFRLVTLLAAPGPAIVAASRGSKVQVVEDPLSTGPVRIVLADSNHLQGFLIVPDKGDSGSLHATEGFYEARSKQKDRAPVGDGDGVVLRIPGGDAMRLSGRRVRIEATLRSSRVQGSASLKMMYSRSGEGNSSGWVELPVAKDFKTVSFEYTVPKSPPGPFDFVAVWADPTGNGRGVDFKDVVVRTIE